MSGGCYGRPEHRWSVPMKSSLYRCTVKICSRCGRVAKVDGATARRAGVK